MTARQEAQFNQMLLALRKIASEYQTPDQLRRSAPRDLGIDAEEAVAMAYENIQQEARSAIKGVRKIEAAKRGEV